MLKVQRTIWNFLKFRDLLYTTINLFSFICFWNDDDWRLGLDFVIEQVLYWLSGLTCTDENFIIKSGTQRSASSEGVALITPDTSPSKNNCGTHFQVLMMFLGAILIGKKGICYPCALNLTTSNWFYSANNFFWKENIVNFFILRCIFYNIFFFRTGKWVTRAWPSSVLWILPLWMQSSYSFNEMLVRRPGNKDMDNCHDLSGKKSLLFEVDRMSAHVYNL